jgi:hypothetical protein
VVNLFSALWEKGFLLGRDSIKEERPQKGTRIMDGGKILTIRYQNGKIRYF